MQGENSYLIYHHILPGAGVSLLIGNLFYAWQAHRLARKEGRSDVTALPYGINTPSLLIYVYFVMLPVYRETGNPKLAWQMGLLACLGSGFIEFLGSFVAEAIRKHTPRAALLSSLAGIAIGFISMTFTLQIWGSPLVAMLPMAVILVTYFAKLKLPLPGGLTAIFLGTLLAWLLPAEMTGRTLSWAAVKTSWETRSFTAPVFAGSDITSALSAQESIRWLGFLSVIIPMGIFNVVGSLQNIESAEAAGDRYQTMPSLAVNGIGTIAAAFFGSCFPTTIYIGHPGWKELGARAGYSTLNGLTATLICLTGTLNFISQIIPLEACIAIVLWIGIIITAQAFQATPKEHAPAVAFGLFPAIAGWGGALVAGTFNLVSQSLPEAPTIQSILVQEGLRSEVSGFLLHSLNVIGQGYIFTSMILAALSASLIDRAFGRAACWAALGGVLSFIGLIHAYQLKGNVIDFLFIGMSPADGASPYPATWVAIGYFIVAGCFALIKLFRLELGGQKTIETKPLKHQDAITP